MILSLHEIVLQFFQMNKGKPRVKSSCRYFYKFWCEVSKQKDFKEINRFLQALLNSILINRISVTHRNLTPLQAADFTFNSYHNFFIQDRAAKNEENEKKH